MTGVVQFPNQPKYCFECGDRLTDASYEGYLTFSSINGHKGTALACRSCLDKLKNKPSQCVPSKGVKNDD